MLERIEKVLRSYKRNEELTVSEGMTFGELELDSLDTIELVMNLEDEFSVTIEMNEDIKTVGDLMETIKAAQE